MSRNAKLSAIESELRDAVTTGAYEKADLLLSSYSQQLERELRDGAIQSDQLAEEIAFTSDFFGWIFRMVSAAKSHDAAHLKELVTASLYRRPEANHVHSWQLEG